MRLRVVHAVCYRIADQHEAGPGEVRSSCSRCGAAVWFDLDAATTDARDRGTPLVSVVCTRCGVSGR